MTDSQNNIDHKELLGRLRKVEQIAAESQAEAAIYRKMLEECWQAASEALKSKKLDLLYEITGKFSFDWTPTEHEGKEWGKLFLHAYMRDAGWLKHAKKQLEQIRTDAEMILENEPNPELKRKVKKIMDAAEDGLTTHI